MKTNFFSRLFARSTGRRDLELAYLNQAVSLYDLERRQYEIDHGLFKNA